ncbi:MAG: response regulator [Armatimonadota bacterium]
MATSCRILFVEDDVDQQAFYHTVLTRAGYQVTTVPYGEEALRTLDDPELRLVIVDLALSEASGEKMLAAVHARRPDVKTILMGSRLAVVILSHYLKADAPFHQAEGFTSLLALIQRLLGGELSPIIPEE